MTKKNGRSDVAQRKQNREPEGSLKEKMQTDQNTKLVHVVNGPAEGKTFLMQAGMSLLYTHLPDINLGSPETSSTPVPQITRFQYHLTTFHIHEQKSIAIGLLEPEPGHHEIFKTLRKHWPNLFE